MGCGSGAGGFCAGGTVLVGAPEEPPSTERERLPRRDEYTDSVIEVTMKMMAAQVVAFVSTVAAVRVPNAVWLPMPPKAAAISAL